MNEERRLIAMGFPMDVAAGICWTMRREGCLQEFLKKQEEDYKEKHGIRQVQSESDS